MPASHPRLNLRSASQQQFHRPRRFSCYWRQARGDDGSGAPSSVVTASGTLVSKNWENINPQQEQTSELRLKESPSRNGSSSAAATAVAPPNASFVDFPVQAAAVAAGMAPPPPLMIEESQQRMRHRENEHREVPSRPDHRGERGLRDRTTEESGASPTTARALKQARDDRVTNSISSNDSQHRDQPQAMTFEEFKEMKRLLNNQPMHFHVQNPSSLKKSQ